MSNMNTAKKRLYMTLKGRLSMSELKSEKDKAHTFNIITDLTKYLPVSEENRHMKKWLIIS